MNYPIILAALCGAVALAGIIATLIAMNSLSKERKNMARARAQLLSSASWEEAKVDNQQSLNAWITSQHIDKTSHVGSIIRTAWLSWYLGRPANAAEFHANIARRERKRHSTRLASGIAATLLIVGIVSTLWCVKDVLKDFQIAIQSDGSVTSASDNVTEANDLMHHLADAFLPSMAALFGTILVVVFRGIYASKIHHLVVDLDELTDSLILPRFRVAPLSVQFESITNKLFTIASKIEQRDANFGKAVEVIGQWSDKLVPSLEQFELATTACTNAAQQLTANTQSLSSTLDNKLGRNSELVTAITNLGYSYDEAKRLVGTASVSLEQFKADQKKSEEALSSIIEVTRSSLSDIPAEVEKQCQIAGESSAQHFDSILKSREGAMLKSAETVANKLSNSLTPSVEAIKQSATSMAQSQASIKAESDGLLAAAKQNLNELTSASTSSIEGSRTALHGTVKSITSSLDSTKSQISTATQELKTTVTSLPEINRQLKANSDSIDRSTEQVAKAVANLKDTTEKRSKFQQQSTITRPVIGKTPQLRVDDASENENTTTPIEAKHPKTQKGAHSLGSTGNETSKSNGTPEPSQGVGVSAIHVTEVNTEKENTAKPGPDSLPPEKKKTSGWKFWRKKG